MEEGEIRGVDFILSDCQNTCNIDISVVDPEISEQGEGEGEGEKR